jgi:carbon-monoxide dehydrogenase large subunit
MERLMDEAARQTGIDRMALRRRNFIQPEQMPYKNPMGQVYDTGKFEQVMDKGLVLADWNGFAAREAVANSVASCVAWVSPLSWNGPAATCLKSALP